MAGKNVNFPGTNESFPPCLISLHFFMYFFILEVKIPSKCQNYLGTRFLSSLFFPGMQAEFPTKEGVAVFQLSYLY